MIDAKNCSDGGVLGLRHIVGTGTRYLLDRAVIEHAIKNLHGEGLSLIHI